MRYLFIAEKPSLMQSVKECYENHKDEINRKVGSIDFIALSGHVCTNYEPNDYEEWNINWNDIEYPMIPESWGLKVISNKSKKETVDRIDQIARSYDGIIVGTDSDTEGYGIYFNLEHYLGIDDMHALRFIEHSLTDEEIKTSLLSMTDYHYDETHVRFQNSYMIRSYSDWLYGMNATRMMSCRLGQLMTIGRVKAPTIRLVYDNSMAIENFQQKTFYVIEADYGQFKGILCGPNGKRWETDAKETAVSCANMISLAGVVAGKNQKDKTTHAPKLYDLTSIQADAGARYGYTPTKTLSIIQSLYEKHKVISYPRTQCRYVSSEKAKEFPQMLKKMRVFDELAPYADIPVSVMEAILYDREVVNDAEVLKESHDALLPTQATPNLNAMTQDEINVCLMIYKRLLAQFLPKMKEKKTQLLMQHPVSQSDGHAMFLVEGRVIIEPGWSVLYTKLAEKELPDLQIGEEVCTESIDVVEKKTNPPKRLTQHSLIAAMKNIASLISDKELRASLADSQGIGTPATRANIIEDIIKRGYVKDNKGLYITELGKIYIESLADIDIVKPEFAAVIDTRIKKIQRGEADYVDVYNEVVDGLYDLCDQINEIEYKKTFVGECCPKCKAKQLEMTTYYYACTNPDCDFKVSRKIAGVAIDEKDLHTLIAGKKTGKKKFRKKDGTGFEARLLLNPASLSVEFDFSSGLICPYCQKDIRVNKGGWFCDCGLKIYKTMSGRNFKESEVKTLLSKKRVNKLVGFMKKDGNYFSHPTDVYLDDQTKTVKFDFGSK